MNRILLILTLLFPLVAHAQAPASAYVGPIPVYDKFETLAPLLNKANDTTYVINFWATWCKPCVQEMPYFEAVHVKYAKQKVKVILVSLDFSRQLESKLLPFVQERGLKPEVIALTDSNYNTWIDKVSPEWSGAIPITIIRKGKNQQVVLREFENEAELEDLVKEYINLK
jgi:thiol-disulfide isomerase/thioredoxin